jgi:hypothetical protein
MTRPISTLAGGVVASIDAGSGEATVHPANAVTRARARRLTVDGRPFLWRRTHRHRAENGPTACVEILRVFPDGNKKAVLQITFAESPGWTVGYPQAGVIRSTTSSTSYNLNRPVIVAALIRAMLATEWKPFETDVPVEVDDGIALLESSGAPKGSA